MAPSKRSCSRPRARKISFGAPLQASTSASTSTSFSTSPPSPPPQAAKTRRPRPFLRSPFPSSSSSGDLSRLPTSASADLSRFPTSSSGDLSGPSSVCSPSTPTRLLFTRDDRALPPPPAGSPRRRYGHYKNESLGDVFLENWNVPRPPPSDVEPDYPSLESENSPSPSPKMPRIDFGRGRPIPVVARGGTAFTPRPAKTPSMRDEFSPSRALGRKISLSNLGPAYAAVEAEQEQLLELEADDDMEELEDFDDTREDSYRSTGSFTGLARLGAPMELSSSTSSTGSVERPSAPVEFPPSLDMDSPAAPAANLDPPDFADDEDEVDLALDADEVNLELDIRHLSLNSTSTENASSSDGGSAPTTPGRHRDRDLAVPLVPSGALSPALSAISTLSTLSKSATSESLGESLGSPIDPNESIEIMSPSHSPPPLGGPSVPATPRHEAMGYASDESDVIVPRRRLVGRRIIVSDDEEEQPRRSLRGLRGRIPAAIARLNALQSDNDSAGEGGDDDEPEFLVDGSYDISQDTMGSLRDFIADSEVEEEVADDGSSPEEEGESSSSSSDVDSDEPEQVDDGELLPPAIPVINLVSDSEDDVRSSPTKDVLHFTPPPPPLPLPDVSGLSLDSPSPEKLRPPPRPKPRKQMTPREWEAHRAKYAESLFDELDANVFDSRLGRHGAGCTIKWDNRIAKSAGMAHRRSTRHKDGSSSLQLWIALSPKVLSEDKQIRDTLAHEMCHVAAWVISKEFKNPHGKVFKSWGRKVMRARPDISVTTKHDYVINYKYEWQCTNVECRKIYKRHSKSIDTTRQVCGACRSRLAPLFATKELSPYQQYVKTYMKAAQAKMPGATFGQISRALSDRWTAAKGASDEEHHAYWRDYAA